MRFDLVKIFRAPIDSPLRPEERAELARGETGNGIEFIGLLVTVPVVTKLVTEKRLFRIPFGVGKKENAEEKPLGFSPELHFGEGFLARVATDEGGGGWRAAFHFVYNAQNVY